MDRLESLYGALSAKYDLGSFDEFKTKLEDPEKRKALYEFASNDFELGDFDSFSLKIEDSFKKKEDGESLSQEDTSVGDDLMGFYEKSSADAFKDYRKKTIDKYSEVIKKDPTFAAIADNINANLKRRYNRLVDSYLYNPSFDRNNPEAIAQANREIEQQFKEMRKNAFNENEEYKALLDKYDTELKDVITSEYQARLKDEGRAIADVQKEAALKSMSSTIHPFMGILSSAAKGEGIISAFGDAIVYKIPQAFQAYNLADDSQRYNKLSDSLKELEDMDANQPVYLSEKGNYMKVTQKEGVDIPSQTNFGTLMTAAEAADVVRDMSDIKLKEISPKLESALELNEFVNRISQTKGLTEDMSFGNIMRNIAEQVPNMAVAAVAPVIGTTILEAGNTYVEQIIEIARQEKGEDYTTQDVLDIIERGDDGAALSQSSGVISGGLDVIGLAGITSVIMTPVKSLGKQILKQGVKEGIKKIGKTKAAEIGLGIAKSGFWEGVTEGLQGANMQFSKIETVERATGTRLEFDWKPVMEEALMGGIMGGVFGGVGTTFNVLTDNNTTGLPEDDITLAAVSEDKSYFDGSEAISRNQADQRIKRAKTIKELEKIRVANDEPLIAKFLERKAELEKAAVPVEESLKENESIVGAKEDEKGRTFTYISETSEKDGVTTTKFNFNRSDKDSTQRNTAFVEPEMALQGKYEVDEEGIPEDTVIVGISQIIEGKEGIGADVKFQALDEEGNPIEGQTFTGEVKLRRVGDEAAPPSAAAPEIAPEEIVAEDKPAVEEKTYKIEDISLEDEIKGLIKSGKPGKEVFNYDGNYVEKFGPDGDYNTYRYTSGELLNDPNNRDLEGDPYLELEVYSKSVGQGPMWGFRLEYAPTGSAFKPSMKYSTLDIYNTRKEAEQAALEVLRNPKEFYSGAERSNKEFTESEVAQAFFEAKGIEPIAEPVAEQEIEDGAGMYGKFDPIQFIYTTKQRAVGPNETIVQLRPELRRDFPYGTGAVAKESDYTFVLTRSLLTEIQGTRTVEKKFSNREDAIKAYEKEIDRAFELYPNDIYKTEREREGFNWANRKSAKTPTTKQELLDAIDDVRTKIGEPKVKPTKKVVGTLEVEEEEEVTYSPIKKTLVDEIAALDNQLNAEFINDEEYAKEVATALDNYQKELNKLFAEGEPTAPDAIISAEDSQADILEFEKQSPKLRFTRNLLRATRDFRGTTNLLDLPLRVVFYKTEAQLAEIEALIQGRTEDVPGGFYDLDSNTIFLSEETAPDKALIHEFTHPIAKRILFNNRELANKLAQEALQIPGIQEFVNQYIEEGEDVMTEEAIVDAIARAALKNLQEKRTIPQRIKDFFMRILDALGLDKGIVIGNSKSSLEDFIKNISEAFATGRRIRTTGVVARIDIAGVPVNKIKVRNRAEIIDDVPIVKLSSLENQTMEPIVYDNLRTGDVEYRNPITRTKIVKKNLMGGVLHPFLKAVHEAGVVAAFTSLNKAIGILNKINNENIQKLGLFLSSKESSLYANREIRDMIFSEGGIVEDILNSFDTNQFMSDLSDALAYKGKNESYAKFQSDVKAMTSLQELTDYVSKMDFDTYRQFFSLVFPEVTGSPRKTILQNTYGMPTRGQLVSLASEDITTEAKEGDLVSVVTPESVLLVNEAEFKKLSAQKISELGELGIEVRQMPKAAEHKAYPYAIGGKADGVVEAFVNAREILPSIPLDATNVYYYAERRGADVVEEVTLEGAEPRPFVEDGVTQSRVTAAPIRVFPEFFARKYKGKNPTVKDIIDIKNGKIFKTYRKNFIDAAKMFNLTVANLTTNIGIWEGALEYSNNLDVKGNAGDIRAFAAYMGLVAEPQEATIVSRVREGGESTSIDVVFKKEQDALKAVTDLRAQGVVGLSYDTDRKIITIFAQDGDVDRVKSFYESNKSKIQSTEFYEADVEFIAEADYERILIEHRSKEQNQGAGRKDLRDAITEVLGQSPLRPFGLPLDKVKHTKSTRQNIIRPAEAIQEEFKKRLTPRRVGSTYYGKLGILTTVDINELGGLVNPNTGVTIGLDLVKEYNKVMPELVKQVMPLPKQLEPALQLADKIREALDFTTHDKIVEYARILLASIDEDPAGYTSDQEAIDAIRDAFVEFDVQEFTETDLEFVTENISEIRGYASEVYLSGLKNTKFSDRMKGTKYEGREALVKNDIVRSATEILLQQRDELAAAGYKKISVEQLDLTDTHMEAIAEKLGGGEDFVKILKSNRKSITNMARNDLRNKNVVSGLVESSKRYFQRGIPRKYIQGDIYASEKVLDKILAIIKPKFSDTEIKVLEDYMEYSEVRRLFQTIQSLQHGYLPPMAYGIIRKFEAAVNAVELAGKVGNMSIMLDANGRLIKERVAVREARELTTPSEELTKSEMDALQKRTTTGAMPFFKRQVDKVIPILYNQIQKAFSVIESQREIDIAKYNEKFAKVKPIARFEGTQYTNSDVNMLGHMYLIEKQYLSNPGSNKVPKLYESLIASIKNKNNVENNRYIELFEDFKLENNTLDIQKVERFLKFMGAMTGATKESGMGIVDFVSKRMRDSRDRVRHLQEFQNKTQVEVFDNYIYVATKENANTGEVKADMIESLLNTDSANTLGFAKTSISRQSYRNTDGTLRKLQGGREPVFDLMFAANYATNEVLSAYHLGEEFRNVQAQLNILAKLGDAETQVLAVALKNDIRQRIINSFEYKMDRPTNMAEKFIQKMLAGTYTTYLASARRFIELVSNAFLVSIANPTVARAMVFNAADNIGDATMNETKSIMDKIGSAHRERFNKTGKAFYSAEGIGAERIVGAKQTPSIWDKVKKKDGEFREAYVAFKNAMNRLGEIQTGIKNFGDKIVRMSDTKIGAVAWNAIFKERFQEITGIEYSSAMLTDADLFIQNRLAMKEAGNYADIFIKENFAGGAFDMNQKALKNKGTMKYIQNMFRTFRTFYYESNRNAVRSLLDGRFGIEDGTMTKEEAARRLAGASAASIIYAVGTSHLMSLLWQQLFLGVGLADEEEEREWTTAAKQAVAEFVLLSSIGRAPAIGYGLVSGAVRGTIRYMDQEDLTVLEGLNKFAQRLSGSNFLLRQTVPIIGEPAMLAKKTIESALDAAQGELEGEDAQELFLEILKTAVIYQGIPFSGDIMSGLYTLQRMNEEEKKPKKKKKPKFKSVLD